MIAETRRNPAPAWLPTENALLARLRRGEDLAFEELVRSASPSLLATLRRLLPSEEDARDALRETFVAAFRSLESFEGPGRLSTWLHGTAVKAALAMLRSRGGSPEPAIDDLLPRFDASGHRVVDPADPARAAGQRLDGERRHAAVRRCIDRLPETHRSVLLLRDVAGLGNEETARALGLSAAAAKARLHRARQALLTLLARDGILDLPGGAAGPRRAPRAAAGSGPPAAARPHP